MGKNLTFKIGKSGGAQAWRPPSVHPLPLVLLPSYKGASPQAPPTPALLVKFWLLDWSPNVFLCRSLSLFHFSPFIHLKLKSDSSAITMTSLLHLIDWFIVSSVQTDEFLIKSKRSGAKRLIFYSNTGGPLSSSPGSFLLTVLPFYMH